APGIATVSVNSLPLTFSTVPMTVASPPFFPLIRARLRTWALSTSTATPSARDWVLAVWKGEVTVQPAVPAARAMAKAMTGVRVRRLRFTGHSLAGASRRFCPGCAQVSSRAYARGHSGALDDCATHDTPW